MAIFNPDVKDVSSELPINSKAIEGPRLISGKGQLLSGIGNMIETAAKGTDAVITTMATNEATNMARTERDAYISALEAGERVASGEVQLPGQPQQQDTTLFGEDPANVPQDIRTLPQKLNTLNSAKNAGKIAQTDFHGRVATLARDLRSRYGSAYWPTIDQATASVLGVDPANAYIRGILSQISSRQESGRNEMNYVIAAVRKAYEEGNVALKRVYKALLNGTGDPAKAMEMVALSNQNKYRAQQLDMEFNLKEKAGKLTREDWNKRFTVTSSDKVMEFFNGVTQGPLAAGAPPGSLDAPMTEDQSRIRGEALTRQRALAAQWMWNKAQKDGTLKTLGAEEVNKLIEQNLKPFDIALTSISDKNFGDVGRVERNINAIKNNTELTLLTDPDLGIYVRENTVMKGLDSTFLYNWNQTAITHGNLTEAMKAYQIRQKARIAGQLDAKGNPVSPGNPTTFNTALDNNERDNITSPNSLADIVSLVDGGKTGGKNTSGLLDPKMSDEGKRNIAIALVHPKNLGFISRLNPNQQIMMFNRLTSLDVQKELKRLSAKYPEIEQYTRNWVAQTFSKEIFQKEILNLNEINSPNLGLRWSDEDKQWFLEVKANGKVIDPAANLSTKTAYFAPGVGGGTRPIVSETTIKQARQTINRLNQGIRPLITMHATWGVKDQDVGSSIIRSLMDAGYSPENLPEGLPSSIVDSIIAARKKAEETKKKWNSE